MASINTNFYLKNGVKIPCVGFGTWQIEGGEQAVGTIETAISVGYRLIDTASYYQNEQSVGEAVKRSGVNRKDLFITSKLWNDVRGYDETIEAVEKSLRELDMDYMDSYLIHWPAPIKYRENWEEMNAQSWRAMEDLYLDGKILSLGVSNFDVKHLEALFKTAKIYPTINQIQYHPGHTQPEIVSFCHKNQIQVQAWSPLASGKVFELDVLKALAKKYNKSISQICLAWCLQNNVLSLSKSSSRVRMEENTDIFDFTISDEDMEIINAIDNCKSSILDLHEISF